MTVEALRHGRPAVLADLLERYGRDMQAVAYLILRDRAAAEDVVADSLLAALDHGHSLRDDGAAPAVAPSHRDQQGAPLPPAFGPRRRA